MCGHKHSLPCLELGLDLGLPIRHHAGDGVLEALCVRDVLAIEARILCLVGRVVLAGLLQGRRRDVEAAAPDLDLLGAVLDHCLLLVEAREAAVHALVEAPSLVHGHEELVSRLECEVQGLDGPLEEGGVGNVDLDALRFEQLAGTLALPHTLIRQVHIDPAREAIRDIPLRLAVAREDKEGMRRRHGCTKGRERIPCLAQNS
mmetsp:Transcript_24887/g.52754  ORF Transcript_24887/g.52754 Transcript_24887/m.52754 type:complete len:203 (-) Transcript_24887:2-610(-)